MMRPIELDQLADMGLPRSPRAMRPLAAPEMLDPARPQPQPQGLVAERDPVVLGQFLRRQRRPKIAIALLVQLQDLRFPLLGNPSVRRLPAPPMHQPLGTLPPARPAE